MTTDTRNIQGEIHDLERQIQEWERSRADLKKRARAAFSLADRQRCLDLVNNRTALITKARRQIEVLRGEVQ